jgi:two-component system, OmpR family, response regulator
MTPSVGSHLHTHVRLDGTLTAGLPYASSFKTPIQKPVPQSDDALAAAQSRPLRVLLVEDSALIRRHLVALIEDTEGVTVSGEVDTEADAIAALQRDDFDAAVVDLQLREGSGFGVLQHLKANRPDVLAIVLTNSNTSAMRARSMALGAHHFLDKSSEFDCVGELLEAMRKP